MSKTKRLRASVSKLVSRAGYRVVRTGQSDEHLYEAYDASTLAARPFINIGAGSFRHRHWTNVDYQSEWYREHQAQGYVHYDLTAIEPLPFETARVELAYTSHTVEHVDNEAVGNLFAECHRVLKPGGALRITCPDARLLYRAAREQRLAYWHWLKAWFQGPQCNRGPSDEVTVYDYLVREIATARCRYYVHGKDGLSAERLEQLMDELPYDEFLDRLVSGVAFDPSAPGNHINWWDENKVSAYLFEAGFADVRISRRGQSMFGPMTNPHLFDATKPENSLYVEAIR